MHFSIVKVLFSFEQIIVSLDLEESRQTKTKMHCQVSSITASRAACSPANPSVCSLSNSSAGEIGVDLDSRPASAMSDLDVSMVLLALIGHIHFA